MEDQNIRTSVMVRPKSSIEGDYIVFTLEKIGVNLQRGKAPNQRTAWVSFVPSTTEELRVYQPLMPGAGPAPTDAIALVQIQDIVFSLGQQVEQALVRLEQDELAKVEAEKDWK